MAKQAVSKSAGKRSVKKPAAPKAPARKAAPKKAAPRPRRAATKLNGRATSSARTPTVKQGRIEALTQVFAALGALQPSTWARSHVADGHDELGRFVLLRALWLKAVEPGRLLGIARNEADVSAAVDRVLRVVDLADLDAIIRFAQRQALLDICNVLDDPSASDEGIGWAVYRTDGRGLPLWALDRLSTGLTDSEPR